MNSWENIINSDKLKNNLMASSLYLCSYEVLKNSIVDGVKNFFINGFRDGEYIIDEKYYNDVLSLDKNIVSSSLMWLKKMDAISEEDIMQCRLLKQQRDDIAHSLINILESQDIHIQYSYLKNVLDLLEKIEKWWIINFEIPINPDYDGKEINEENVIPGSVLVLKHMIKLANDINEK